MQWTKSDDEVTNLKSNNSFAISFYAKPPQGKIDLFKIHDMIEERLNILSVFDNMKLDPAIGAQQSDYYNILRERLKNAPCKYGENFLSIEAKSRSHNSNEKKDARMRDQISHFLLRLYYCRDEELKTWFISRESDLFRFRMMESKLNEITQIIEDHELGFTKLSESEVKNLFNNINFHKYPLQFYVYRVEFEKCVDLVRQKKVYLNNGYAYVMSSDMITLLTQKFKLLLALALGSLRCILPTLNENNRIIPIIHTLHHKIKQKKIITTNSISKNSITCEMIDDLKEFFPPCMENIHNNLRTNHHLKHYARIHYGLFLKSIGLSLDESIKFFREEFIKIMDINKFDRQYKYGIRYNYGQEGKRTSFSAYSCNRIINEPVAYGDVHGCPFRNFDAKNLKKMLTDKGAPENTISEILSQVEKRQYTNACKAYFMFKNPHYVSLETIYHPTQFYAESQSALKYVSIKTQEEDKMDEEFS